MRTQLLRLLALLALALSASGQTGVNEAAALNQQVLAACFAEKWDEALSLLGQQDKLAPESMGTAYNFACVYSRKAEADKAVEWTDKSIQWGWGGSKGIIAVSGSQATQRVWHSEMLEKDSDLENLRKDERFVKLLERAKALQKRAETYAAAPLNYVPEKLKDAAELPLLVVLHDSGGNKEAVLAAWKPLADELGYALVVPAAPFPLREDASKGVVWIDDTPRFQTALTTSEYMKPIHASVDALRKTRKLAAGKVFLAGEGQGATLALVTAMHNSGLYKGVAVLDPEVITALVSSKVQTDKANGLRLELRLDPEFWKQRAGGQDPKPVLDLLKQPVEGWALAGSVTVLGPEPKDAAARQRVLADAIRALASAAAAGATPAPASAPK